MTNVSTQKDLSLAMPILTPIQILEYTKELPSISVTAVQLVSLIDNPRTTRERIANLVIKDQVIFAQCFKHANSAASGSMRELKTIKEIVDLLGFGYIKKAALFVAANSIIDDPAIWFESVFVAIAAEFLAKRSGLDKIASDQVYMAGLFQNYGAFLLKTIYPNLYATVTAVDDFKLRMEREKKEFGYTYPAISALVLREYGLPDRVLEIINKQELVYISDYEKENIYIEIARILCKIQAKKVDIGLIRDHLGVEGIEAMVMNSGLNLVDIDEKSLEEIKEIVSEFV